jgi:hypothetical protein
LSEGDLVKKQSVVIVLAVFALLFGYMPAMPALAANGVECGCSKTGPFVDPDHGATAAVAANGDSPGGVYRVTATGNGPIDLTVRRISDNSLRLSGVSVPASSAWGFSPDDHRFLYQYTMGTVHYVVLWDLVAMRGVWQTGTATSSSRVAFSPHGKYLLYATTAAPHTDLLVVDAVTPYNTRFQTSFNFVSPPGTPGDTFGVAHWGWSPDDDDRSFVMAFVTGQSSVQLDLVNLAATSNRQVLSTTLTSISGFWQFSPCGDLLGIVTQPNQSQVMTQLIRTINGAPVTGANQTFPFAAVTRRPSRFPGFRSVPRPCKEA